MPFTDPQADGATIQATNQVALSYGVTMDDTLGFVREARAQGLTIPVVLMGYCNPFLQYGVGRLAAATADAGADGFIVVDLPPEEAAPIIEACDANGLACVPRGAARGARRR